VATKRYLADDIVKLYSAGDSKTLVATLFWGDEVSEIGRRNGLPVFRLARAEWNEKRGDYEVVTQEVQPRKPPKFRKGSVLKVRFVDVGQGDGAMIETPRGQRLLVDGGEGPWFRRYIRVAYAYILKTKPLFCDAIVVTHGDADHYAGLTELVNARLRNGSSLITAERVFHNGLVKSSSEDVKRVFGKTAKVGKTTYVVDLEEDLLRVPAARLNTPFRAWQEALRRLKKNSGKLHVRRLAYGDGTAFDFLQDDGLKVQVLGPIVEEVRGKPALPFLKRPGTGSLSASHTINGHSVVLKVSYGNVRFLLGGDLNEESEERLLAHSRERGDSLASEVLKVPHHGSADFSPRALEAIRPVVSVVSSGDETVAKEYIHPRAGLMGALGKYSRATVDRPLVYATEMVAFFRRVKTAYEKLPRPDKEGNREREMRNAYEKKAFGIVHVRTDGERVLVATHSGKDNQKESYAFRVDERGDVRFEETAIL